MADYAAYKQRKARNATASASVYIDTRELKKLAADMLKVNKVARAEMLKSLKAAGEIVAADARTRASYSRRIPGSIKVRRRGVDVSITAGGEKAPNAAPIENKGKGFVRHPVFIPEEDMAQYQSGNANRPNKADHPTWGPDYPFTSKKSRPAFLVPAIESKAEEVVMAIEEAQRVALAACGFGLD